MLACLCNWCKFHNHFFSGFLLLQLHFLYTHFICIDLLSFFSFLLLLLKYFFCWFRWGSHPLLLFLSQFQIFPVFTSSLLSCLLLFSFFQLSSLPLTSPPLPVSLISPPLIFPPFSSPLFYMDTMSCCSSAACQWRLRLWSWIVLDSFPGQLFWLKPGQSWNCTHCADSL